MNLVAQAGTSLSTAYGSAAAMLIRQYFMDGYYAAEAFTPSAALLKAMLINSGTDLFYLPDNAGIEGPIPNSNQGWGRPNLSNVLPFLDGPDFSLLVKDRQGPLRTGETDTHRVTVSNGGRPLKITVAWTDPAAQDLANPTLVNNLDLEVTAPDGTVYLGNNFLNGTTVSGTDDANTDDALDIPDARNNEECVFISTPVVGEYIIRVTGANVPGSVELNSDRQVYSLVATGKLDTPVGVDVSLKLANPSIGEEAGDLVITVELNHKHPHDIDVELDFSGAALKDVDYTVSSEMVTIEAGSLSETVTLTMSQDPYAEGDEYIDISLLNPKLTSKPNLARVQLLVIDDEIAGVTTSKEFMKVSENGGIGVFTVTLDSRPRNNVTLAVKSASVEDLLVSPPELVFTTDNWADPQPVTITGLDDDEFLTDSTFVILSVQADASDDVFDYLPNRQVRVTCTNDDFIPSDSDDDDGCSLTAESNPLTLFPILITCLIVLLLRKRSQVGCRHIC
jgi:hypothetical protein